MNVIRLMKGVVGGIAVAGGLLLVPISSATAAPPNTGCPVGYQLQPISFLNPSFTGIADNVNHDGKICARPQQTPRGIHFSIMDNTAPSR